MVEYAPVEPSLEAQLAVEHRLQACVTWSEPPVDVVDPTSGEALLTDWLERANPSWRDTGKPLSLEEARLLPLVCKFFVANAQVSEPPSGEPL